jgi:hypothetical protein
MNKGKITCDVLKEIRKQIASENKIDYHTHDCTFEGECRGTCPACESEVQYLENEIVKRKYLGKAVVVAGLSVGLLGTFTGCYKGNQIEPKNDNESQIKNTISNSIDSLNINKNDSINILKKNTNEPFEPFIGIEMPEPEIFFPEYDTTYQYDSLNIDGIIENKAESKVFNLVEQMPEFPGGIDSFYQYLSKVITYPEIGTIDVNGIVLIEFVIEKDGSISNVIAKQKLYPEFDAEAIRVIQNSPKWIPGKQLGKPVRVLYQIPIKFYIK